MISTTARYVYTVYRTKSVSLAAEELFISQPALSRAIKKAETELGAPIFNRKTLPFSLTPQGKLYIDAIEKALQLEKETAEKINDIRHVQGGTLRIGTSLHLSFYVIPKVLKEFQKQYPHVDIHIVMTDTEKLYEQLQKENVDLVFMSGESAPSDCHVVNLLQERFVVAMPRSMVTEALRPYALNHKELLSGHFDPQQEINDMSVFRNVSFIYSPPHTNVQKKRTMLFGKSDMAPYVTSNASRQQLNYNLMRTGFGALLTTDANIATMPPDPDCSFFALGGSEAKQDFSLIHIKKDTDVSSRIVQEFISTATTFFACDHPLHELLL